MCLVCAYCVLSVSLFYMSECVLSVCSVCACLVYLVCVTLFSSERTLPVHCLNVGDSGRRSTNTSTNTHTHTHISLHTTSHITHHIYSFDILVYTEDCTLNTRDELSVRSAVETSKHTLLRAGERHLYCYYYYYYH